MIEMQEWTEIEPAHKVTRREHVWKTPEFDYWLMTTQWGTYFVWGPGFLAVNTWRAGWTRPGNNKGPFDGYWEADRLEDAIQNFPYRVAVAIMETIKADPPVIHNASRYDHEGCRCDICKADKAAKNKAYRERKAAAS